MPGNWFLKVFQIFGLTDWIRSVTDQLAAEGFIAIAPDLLSGKGPNGGGTSSLDRQAAIAAIRSPTSSTGRVMGF